MSLVEYKRKRHFAKTPEPAGEATRPGGWSFVIQKHHASHLHFDFRLELDGVLKSWAVPKGPCLDPSVKRLAVHVEDHPVEYGSFEGTIPEGEYGGGTVMLWDRGTWEPIGDPDEGYRKGRLKFMLRGEKLHGAWMLVRTGYAPRNDSNKTNWLLFKEKDRWTKCGASADIDTKQPLSVTTGRTLEQIATDADLTWNSKTKTATQLHTTLTTSAPGKRTSKLPRRIDVQLATLVDEAPDGDEWLHEIKLDGYRIISRLDHGKADLLTRNHNNWTKRLTSLAEDIQKIAASDAILDGELVALRPDGTTDFQELQNAFRDGTVGRLYYYVFDLLHLDGRDLSGLPLEQRKQLLADLLIKLKSDRIRVSDHFEGSPKKLLEQGCKMHLEGIICKRKDRPYRAGRGTDWLKVKCIQSAELVIGGYTDPAGAREGLGALLLGRHNDAGDLVYAGKVGTGFDHATLLDLQKQLEPLQLSKSPFADKKRAMAKTHWVEPTLVAQVKFASWTRDNLLRHATFQGLREDKPAKDLTREVPAALNTMAKRKTNAHTAQPKESPSNEYDPAAETFKGVRLTHPEKVLYPDDGITKLELATYYQSIAEWVLPHMVNRPLVLVRCPSGQQGKCFYQKHPTTGTPEALRRIPIRESDGTHDYVVVDDVKGLISLVQMGSLEIHAWGSRADNLEHPDRLIFDLDPDTELAWNQVVASARQVRDFLHELGLESFVKTTGGKGLHLVVPIERRHKWPEVKAFCKRVADLIVAAAPDRYTANMSKAARPGKIFIDYLRNARGATAIVPYSTRVRPDATVPVPLTWEELTSDMRSDHFTIRNVVHRLTSLKADPWASLSQVRQSLSKPIRQVKDLSTI